MKPFLLVPLVLAACSPTLVAADLAPRLGANAPGVGDVQLQEDTVLLDEALGLVDLQVGTDQLIVQTDGTELAVRVGDVVVGQLGGGYLRRVREIREQGNRIVLLTDRADLSDAILNGQYLVQAEILDRAATTWDLGGRVLYSGQVFNNDNGENVDVNVFIAEGAQVTFEPAFDFEIDVWDGNWNDAAFAATIDLDYNADFVATVSGALDERIEGTILTRTVPFAFYMGAVPVIGSVEVELIAGIEADFTGQVSTSIHTEASVHTVMDAYYDDDWTFDHNSDIDGDLAYNGTEVDYSLNTRAWVRAQLTVELYGSAGAELGVEPYLELLTCDAGGFDLDGGVNGTHRYYFEALGWSLFDSGVNTVAFGRWDIAEYECAI